MDAGRTHPPTIAWTYGLLGLVPFVGAAAGAWVFTGALSTLSQLGLLIYGGLILSFLGGGRWGLEIGRGPVRAGVISASMAPAVAATLLIAINGLAPAWRLGIMALAHVAQWAWDVRSADAPAWYPRLRHVLTGGAAVCLLAGAAASLRA